VKDAYDLADSAIKGVIGWTDVSGTATSGELTPDTNKKVTIPVATSSTYGIVTIETTSLSDITPPANNTPVEPSEGD
jgi:hypothetical protein